MAEPPDRTRRRFLAAGALAVPAALTPELLWAAVGSTAGRPATDDLRLLSVVADLVIPPTDTPGASAVRVHEFVALAVQHRLLGAEPGAPGRLAKELERRADRPFLALDRRRRTAVLEELDAESYSPLGRAAALSAPGKPGLAAGRDLADWRAIKGLVLLGYYTSEAGATRELRYVFVPGRYDADIPLGPDRRSLMNDWWGNTF
jgi:Gluconate 2-dehydrogenase subunit 3